MNEAPLPHLTSAGENTGLFKTPIRIHLWQPVGCFALFVFHCGLLVRALYHGRAFISGNAGHVGESIFYCVTGFVVGTSLLLAWRKQNRERESVSNLA